MQVHTSTAGRVYGALEARAGIEENKKRKEGEARGIRMRLLCGVYLQAYCW